METRQVEFTETVRIGATTFEAGDRKSFPKPAADAYIGLGWAKDPVTEEQGERRPGGQPLNVDAMVSEGV